MINKYLKKYISISIYVCIYVYMVFTSDVFLEVPTESWPEWNLNP